MELGLSLQIRKKSVLNGENRRCPRRDSQKTRAGDDQREEEVQRDYEVTSTAYGTLNTTRNA